MLYFDHNATSPLCDAARAAWLDATERFIGNPSSPHRLGARAEAALDEARARLAARLGCEPWEVIWTSGATESANTIVQHFAASGEGDAWISAIEHPSLLQAVRRYFPRRYQLMPVCPSGAADLDWLRDRLRQARPAFVGLMAANNETGVLQPWREAATLCREAGVPVFCDAAQWVGKLPAAGLGECEAVSGCGHKFGGPQGVGFLKFRGRLRPLLVGGRQEDGQRAGTENVAGILAMVAALEKREAQLASGGAVERQSWREEFITGFLLQVVEAEIVSGKNDRLWNTVSVVMPPIDCRQRWVVKLDKLGFAVSTGSACASGREEPSHVLRAMGIAPEAAARVLRLSSGWETQREDWTALLKGLTQAAHTLGATPRADFPEATELTR